jgi:hypothetical protein
MRAIQPLGAIGEEAVTASQGAPKAPCLRCARRLPVTAFLCYVCACCLLAGAGWYLFRAKCFTCSATNTVGWKTCSSFDFWCGCSSGIHIPDSAIEQKLVKFLGGSIFAMLRFCWVVPMLGCVCCGVGVGVKNFLCGELTGETPEQQDANRKAAADKIEWRGWARLCDVQKQDTPSWTAATAAPFMPSVYRVKSYAAMKLILFHLSQPLTYLFIFWGSFCRVDPIQQLLGMLVAVREVTYLLKTALACCWCPVFLLLYVPSVWHTEEPSSPGRPAVRSRCITWIRSASHLWLYLFAPSHFVGRCIEKQLVCSDHYEDSHQRGRVRAVAHNKGALRTHGPLAQLNSALFSTASSIFDPIQTLRNRPTDMLGPSATRQTVSVMTYCLLLEFIFDCASWCALVLLLRNPEPPMELVMGYCLTTANTLPVILGFIVSASKRLYKTTICSVTAGCWLIVCVLLICASFGGPFLLPAGSCPPTAPESCTWVSEGQGGSTVCNNASAHEPLLPGTVCTASCDPPIGTYRYQRTQYSCLAGAWHSRAVTIGTSSDVCPLGFAPDRSPVCSGIPLMYGTNAHFDRTPSGLCVCKFPWFGFDHTRTCRWRDYGGFEHTGHGDVLCNQQISKTKWACTRPCLDTETHSNRSCGWALKSGTFGRAQTDYEMVCMGGVSRACKFPWYGERCEQQVNASSHNCSRPCQHMGKCQWLVKDGTYGHQADNYEMSCDCSHQWRGPDCEVPEGAPSHEDAIVALVALVLLVLLCLLRLLCRRRAVTSIDKANVLRQSLLGGSRELPENILAEKVRMWNSANDCR